MTCNIAISYLMLRHELGACRPRGSALHRTLNVVESAAIQTINSHAMHEF
jgi:hypothetical protein